MNKPLVVVAGLLALAGCGRNGPDTAPSDKTAGASGSGSATIGLSVSTLNNPFFVALRAGAEAEAATKGVKLLTVDAQNDPTRQIASVEDLIERRVRVILLNPTDSDADANVVKQAQAAGIPVISLDRSVNGAEVSSHIASDNVAGGKMAAQFLLQKIDGKGNVIELQGIPGSSAARERGEGFHSVIDANPNVKLVASQPADFDRAKGLFVMENILQANKNIQGIFAHNDEMALGAQKAVEAAGLKNVVIVGFDATADAVAAVKEGKLAATVQQMPDLMGKMGVDAAVQLIAGQQIQKNLPVPLSLITQ
jgi:ribose transport system substrate-binding protein